MFELIKWLAALIFIGPVIFFGQYAYWRFQQKKMPSPEMREAIHDRVLQKLMMNPKKLRGMSKEKIIALIADEARKMSIGVNRKHRRKIGAIRKRDSDA